MSNLEVLNENRQRKNSTHVDIEIHERERVRKEDIHILKSRE